MDDLFGDLPAAKNSTPTEVATTNTPVARANNPEPTPTAITTNDKPDESKPKSSLVTALGTAGTSMAFVPQALRKKKRPVVQQMKSEKRQRQDDSLTKEQVAQIHNEENSVPVSVTVPVDDEIAPEGAQDVNNSNEHDDEEGEPYLENEPPSLRQLHESAKTHPNPYNPHTPNDYLAHRERQKTLAVRQDMQAAALAKLQAHEKLRQRIQEERRRIEDSGDVDRIAQSRLGGVSDGVGRGRGRGRGVSNLPAWLIKKQMEKKIDVADAKEGQFDDAEKGGGCTISLLNMVAPGQIDNELGEEVREECERCGKVVNVSITDATPNNEHVRVDVTFDSRENAVEAIKVFDGRMFGERKIIARMCDDR